MNKDAFLSFFGKAVYYTIREEAVFRTNERVRNGERLHLSDWDFECDKLTSILMLDYIRTRITL